METSKEEYTKQLKQQMQDLEMQRKTTLEINKLEINAQRDQMEQEVCFLHLYSFITHYNPNICFMIILHSCLP